MPSLPVIDVSRVTKDYRLGELRSLKDTLLGGVARLGGGAGPARTPFKALDQVSFTVEPGEVLGIIGHNGAGKSTLLKLLAGITKPTRGSVTVRGKVAPLIEVGAGLVPDLTGRENIHLNATILGMRRAEIVRKFDEIVAFAELEEFIDTPIKRYSSGMQVRLGFAIATSVEAEVLIVDEVLAVGDLAFQRKCFERMEDIIKRQGKTVLLVSHNLRQVERMCTRVILMERGRVVVDGSPGTVCNEFYERVDTSLAQGRLSRPESSSRFATNGDIELLSAALCDAQGNETTIVEYQGDAAVRLRFKVTRKIVQPSFGIGVHTTDFLYLATVQSIAQVQVAELAPGEHVVICRVRSFPFLPGVYSLRVGVALGEFFGPAFYAENVVVFRVVSKAVNRAIESHPGEGFVGLDTEWEITPSRSGIAEFSIQRDGGHLADAADNRRLNLFEQSQP